VLGRNSFGFYRLNLQLLFYLHTGLYQVTQHSESLARGGFKVFIFYLVRCGYQPPPPWQSDRIELPWPSPVHQNSSVSLL
jgi:hypothetical protein